MAIPFYADIDMTLGSIRNVRIDPQSTAPSGPVQGQAYYDTVAAYLYFYNGVAWKNVQDAVKLNGQAASYYLDRTNHTGTQLAATVSDFDTQVRTNRLDQLTAPTADVSMNSHKITNVTDPVSAQDAATKAYVDAQVSGVRDSKESVRLATAAAPAAYTRSGNVITFTSVGSQSVDSVATALNDRILHKNGAAGADNGIYYVSTKGTGGVQEVWTRATDADTSAEVTSGMYCWVNEGTVNADTGWLLTTDDPITLNTTSLAFTQVSGLGQVVAGNGLTKTGNQIDVQVDGASIEISSDTLRVKAGGITDAMLASTFNKKYSQTLTGGATTEVVTHNLGTRDVSVIFWLLNSPYTKVYFDVAATSINTVTVSSNPTIAASTYRIVIEG